MGSSQNDPSGDRWQGFEVPMDMHNPNSIDIQAPQDWPGDFPQTLDPPAPYQMLSWVDVSVTPQFHLNPNLAIPSVSSATEPSIWPPFDLADFGGPEHQVQAHGSATIEPIMDFDSLPSLDSSSSPQPAGIDQIQLEPMSFINNPYSWDNAFNSGLFGEGIVPSVVPASEEIPHASQSPEQVRDTVSEPSSLASPEQSREKTKSASPYDEPQNRFLSDDERWQATVNRLRAADRHFLYGVKTTKIFCRPSCASRRAGRQHVQFFPFPDAIQAARGAGFRPCKRCLPDQLGIIDKGSKGVLKALIAIIRDAFEPIHNKSATCSLKLEDLAKAADLSPFHFQRVFKAATQITPGDFSTACKSLSLQDALAKQLCTCFDFPVAMTPEIMCSACKIMRQCSRWTDRTAKKALGGVKPSEYANGMPGSTVQYVSVLSPPGQAYVTFSGCGLVHSVLIGEDALPKSRLRFINLQQSFTGAAKLEQSIQDLHEESKDRDSEIPEKQLHTLWRGRIWLMIVRDRLLDV